MDEEAIWSAMFALMEGLVVPQPGPPTVNQPLITASRRWRGVNKVDIPEMPALFLVQRDIDPEWRQNRPPKFTLNADVHLYVSTGGDMNAAPGPIYNPIIKALRLILVPQGRVTQDLGMPDHVARCSFGKIEVYDGVLETVSVVEMPVQVIAA